jgi:hypothetical protein
MARFTVLAHTMSAVLTFIYMDAERALKKVRTLQRAGTDFALRDQEQRPLSIGDLENAARQRT